MGIVRAAITLKNVKDMYKAEFGIIKEQEIRQTTVNALVDTGAWTLVINEAVREKLGLTATKTESGTLADGDQIIHSVKIYSRKPLHKPRYKPYDRLPRLAAFGFIGFKKHCRADL